MADFSISVDIVCDSSGDVIVPIHELFIIAGQSNKLGQGIGGSDSFLLGSLDQPDYRVKEYSHGINTVNYNAPPVGQLMLQRQPVQRGVGVSFAQQFGKARANLNPNISEIVLVNMGENGSGFTNNLWGVGTLLHERIITYVTDALATYPDLVLKGMIWQQGESDVTLNQAQYLSELNTMISDLRARIPTAANMPLIVGTMPESWIAADELNRRPIDLAHRNVSGTITNSTFTDLSQYETLGNFHYSYDQQRNIGINHAATAQSFIPA